jgi:alpha-N-acetylglucosaminidase
VNQQYALQKKIIARMVSTMESFLTCTQLTMLKAELGMTPVLPGIAGCVPRAIKHVAPDASVVNGSNWEAFPTALTNTTFLNPADPLFYTLQKKLVQKQQVAYGNVRYVNTPIH